MNNPNARDPNGRQLLCDLLGRAFDFLETNFTGERDCSRIRVRSLLVACVRVRC